MSSERIFRMWGGLLAMFAFGFGLPQAEKKVHVDRPVIPARPGDVSTIEGIVKAGELRDDFGRRGRAAAVGTRPHFVRPELAVRGCRGGPQNGCCNHEIYE